MLLQRQSQTVTGSRKLRVLGEVLDQGLKPLLGQWPTLQVQVAGSGTVEGPCPLGRLGITHHLLEVDHRFLPVLGQVLALAAEQQRLAPLVPLGELLEQYAKLCDRLGVPFLPVLDPAELVQEALADGRFLDRLESFGVGLLCLRKELLVSGFFHGLSDPEPGLGHQRAGGHLGDKSPVGGQGLWKLIGGLVGKGEFVEQVVLLGELGLGLQHRIEGRDGRLVLLETDLAQRQFKPRVGRQFGRWCRLGGQVGLQDHGRGGKVLQLPQARTLQASSLRDNHMLGILVDQLFQGGRSRLEIRFLVQRGSHAKLGQRRHVALGETGHNLSEQCHGRIGFLLQPGNVTQFIESPVPEHALGELSLQLGQFCRRLGEFAVVLQCRTEDVQQFVSSFPLGCSGQCGPESGDRLRRPFGRLVGTAQQQARLGFQ